MTELHERMSDELGKEQSQQQGNRRTRIPGRTENDRDHKDHGAYGCVFVEKGFHRMLAQRYRPENGSSVTNVT